MTKKRRFFIFFSSFGIMTLFLIFTLAQRSDNPFQKYMEWTPNNKVISMILERKGVNNESYPKKIYINNNVLSSLKGLNLTELDLKHAIKNGDVEFSHDSTFAQAKPKQYYILLDINEETYFTIVKIKSQYSTITNFGKVTD